MLSKTKISQQFIGGFARLPKAIIDAGIWVAAFFAAIFLWVLVVGLLLLWLVGFFNAAAFVGVDALPSALGYFSTSHWWIAAIWVAGHFIYFVYRLGADSNKGVKQPSQYLGYQDWMKK